MILLGGRIAEEIIYGKEMVTTGAISDFEEARNLAEKMILYYGMGKSVIHTSNSDKYKETIDEEINDLLISAYDNAFAILYENKRHVLFWAKILMEQKNLKKEDLDFIQTIIL
jgi:ATP-dependent Zn protease